MKLPRLGSLGVGGVMLGMVLIASGDIALAKVQGGPTTVRVSVASNGVEGNGRSGSGSISTNGNFIAFASEATNLVNTDTNGSLSDIFVHDRSTGETTLVSMASNGTQGNGSSDAPFISENGDYIVFQSVASNLVEGDTNGMSDIFVHHRQTGETTLLSRSTDGMQGNGNAYSPCITVDGRYVAFYSEATNLVANDSNAENDVFVHDTQTRQTRRVSVASDGTQGNDFSMDASISRDGRYIAFYSGASNLVRNDTNHYRDVFIHDQHTGETTRVSVAADGTQGNSDSAASELSPDGRYVGFTSNASNLLENDTNAVTDVFSYDRHTGRLVRVSVASDGTEGNAYSGFPRFSGNGRYVGFTSDATNLVESDTNGVQDSFIHDLLTGQTTRVSVTGDGGESNGASYAPKSTADGRYVEFTSGGDTLVSNDTNKVTDVFVREWGTAPHLIFMPSAIQHYAFPVVPCGNQDTEPNDLYRDADQNLRLCADTTVRGEVSLNNAIDIYRIEVEATPASIQVTLSNLPAGGDYDLYLDAGPGNNLDFSTNPGSANETIFFTLAPGRYYIRVVAREDGKPNGYQLQWVSN